MISVHNVRTTQTGPHSFYIGRTMPGRLGSPLGNPFRKGQDGTLDEVLQKYREWIQPLIIQSESPQCWAFFRLREHYKKHKKLELFCWCAPNPCHADIIKELLEESFIVYEGPTEEDCKEDDHYSPVQNCDSCRGLGRRDYGTGINTCDKCGGSGVL